MKNKQIRNLVILAVLVVLTFVSYLYNKIPEQHIAAAQAAAKPQLIQESPLQARFRKIRFEMDALFHYRGKPTPFDTSTNPFRLPVNAGILAAQTDIQSKGPTLPAAPAAEVDVGPALLARAVANIRLGGIVSMNDVIQLNVDGQLHKKGDVFTTKLKSRLVLIRIKDLTPNYVTLALDDPETGVATTRVHLK